MLRRFKLAADTLRGLVETDPPAMRHQLARPCEGTTFMGSSWNCTAVRRTLMRELPQRYAHSARAGGRFHHPCVRKESSGRCVAVDALWVAAAAAFLERQLPIGGVQPLAAPAFSALAHELLTFGVGQSAQHPAAMGAEGSGRGAVGAWLRGGEKVSLCHALGAIIIHAGLISSAAAIMLPSAPVSAMPCCFAHANSPAAQFCMLDCCAATRSSMAACLKFTFGSSDPLIFRGISIYV